MYEQTNAAHDELTQLKSTIKNQGERFIEELRWITERYNSQIEDLKLNSEKVDLLTNRQGIEINLSKASIDTIHSQIENLKTETIELKRTAVLLDANKVENSEFEQAKKKLNLADIKQDINLLKCNGHIATLENFIDKYLPVRLQVQINETLFSILSGAERRRL